MNPSTRHGEIFTALGPCPWGSWAMLPLEVYYFCILTSLIKLVVLKFLCTTILGKGEGWEQKMDGSYSWLPYNIFWILKKALKKSLCSFE